MNFSELNLTLNETTEELKINDSTVINIKSYLPIQDKFLIVLNSLEGARTEQGFYNPLVLETLFHFNLIYYYTDLIFTEAEMEDTLNTFDLLEGAGLVDKIINAIPASEYNSLKEWIEEYKNSSENFENSLVTIVKDFLEVAPEKIKELSTILNQIDLSSMPQVMAIAKQTGIDFDKGDEE